MMKAKYKITRLIARVLVMSALLLAVSSLTIGATETVASEETAPVADSVSLDPVTAAAIKQINALPIPVTLADKSAVETARLLYDLVVDEEQKAFVPYALLLQAEARIAELEAALGTESESTAPDSPTVSEGESGTVAEEQEEGEPKTPTSIQDMMRSFIFTLIGILLLVFLLFLIVILHRAKRVSADKSGKTPLQEKEADTEREVNEQKAPSVGEDTAES